MLGKVLFAIDFSECCMNKVISFLDKIQESVDEILAVHVVDEKEINTIVINAVWIGETTREFEDEVRAKLKNKALEEMEKVKEMLERNGFKVKTVVTEGNPAEKIAEIAEKENVSLIVVGSHGKSNLKSVFLGSVSEGVVRLAKKPVVIVKRDATF
ncbi:MAG TPA: universal stress protein [Archaeoglobus veneficus]|nr:universal stress protein [Archaeoglobus veneficus]